jgi:ABC-type dipeptide/oligopeptide/nickel transport system permease subunit
MRYETNWTRGCGASCSREWIAIFPGLALSITVLAFNLWGDSLRDTFDPRLRGKI